ncbi:MAG: MBL fold metallo-hydrolase [Planctomycetia bacterium]|nr:MBL fold metallo-hydrolase [Planctomycetia bacterium]
MKKNELIFLGTGTSHGVPVIGCECDVCQSPDPRNRRTRSSVLLGFPEGNLLIDTSPDLRQQFLREKLQTAHAILYTHAHVDHLFGLDETRLFPKYNDDHPTPVFCDEQVDAHIRKSFDYIFDPEVQKFPAGGIPKLDMHLVQPGVPFSVLGREVLPILLLHGIRPILGFRIGNFAYCTDVKLVPPQSEEQLHGLDTLVLGCLRYRPHPTHMGLEEAMDFLQKIKPRQTYFTHICHDFDHEKLSAELPENIRPAYDGLRIPF